MKVSELLSLVRYSACDVVTEYRDGECTGFKTLAVFDCSHTWTSSTILSAKVEYFFSEKNRFKVVINGEKLSENKIEECDFFKGFRLGLLMSRYAYLLTGFLKFYDENRKKDGEVK